MVFCFKVYTMDRRDPRIGTCYPELVVSICPFFLPVRYATRRQRVSHREGRLQPLTAEEAATKIQSVRRMQQERAR